MLTLAFYPSLELSSHDLNLALVKNNKVLYSYEEQKLSKTQSKEAKYFPERSFIDCLNLTKFDPKKIDKFCLVGPNKLDNLIKNLLWSSKKYLLAKVNSVCPHHRAHTAYSVLTSNFNQCIFWTLDAGGEDNNYGEFGIFENGKFRFLHKILNPSLPKFYFHITGACGFSDFEEGKIMGLSGYGKFRIDLYKKFEKLFSFDNFGNVHYHEDNTYQASEIDLSKYDPNFYRPFKAIKYLNRNTSKELKSITAGYLPQDIAKTAQILCENYAILSLKKMIKKYNIQTKNIALGGGLFLNILVNKKIREELNFNINVPPGVNDMCLAIGGALWTNYRLNKKKKEFFSKNYFFSPYQGPFFKNNEIKKELMQFNLNFKFLEKNNLYKNAAKDIAKGKVIGWFQGRAEIGPRALGARSVLADPRNKKSKDKVNLLLKKRDWFMPYAPSILEDDAQYYLKNYCFSPYMNIAFDVKEDIKSKIPSAIHVDGTSRAHIVKKILNKDFYLLINHFKKITGISCILNTSFNKHGLPIVSTPRDAIIYLLEGMIDLLYIGNFKVFLKLPNNKLYSKIRTDDQAQKNKLSIQYMNLLIKNKEKKNINSIVRRYFKNSKLIKKTFLK
tara:strand:+ start:18223 stop:20064 length:1842 start_codon:yes stop_codon:yes gene_type:complete